MIYSGRINKKSEHNLTLIYIWQSAGDPIEFERKDVLRARNARNVRYPAWALDNRRATRYG